MHLQPVIAPATLRAQEIQMKAVAGINCKFLIQDYGYLLGISSILITWHMLMLL